MNLGIPQIFMLLIYVFTIATAQSELENKKEFIFTIMIVILQLVLLWEGGFFTECK